ncbi:MAG: dihydropteroate synthase [Acidimicrobiaceae bacterium]|jgi:dihydropteroate synthase|nr:dihydropteroate synthase [Acidimicrobiaceae bacterium]
MGVLNVTPDSFSDGGRWFDHGAAIARGHEMVAQGADVVDVGGESTRPGARPVSEAEELRRIVPVVAELARSVRVSVDTRKAAVAEAAISAGATLINDISATLWPVAASAGVGWVAMHMLGEPGTMQDSPRYEDVVTEVSELLAARVGAADEAGVEEIWVDPGIGFGKTMDHNLQLLRNLDRLVAIGRPVLVATSRKSFLGRLAAGPGQPPAPIEDRLAGSLATAVWSIAHGASMVRAHDVAETVAAVRLLTLDIETAAA